MSSRSDPQRSGSQAYIFAGGGTGGHIYPAIAIIEQLQEQDPHCGIRLLCSDRAVDEGILKETQYSYCAIKAKPIALRPKGLIKFVSSWGPSVRETRASIRELKSKYDRVTLVAMGGFVAAPAARAAKVEGIEIVLVNLDAVPGKANKLIARSGNRMITAAPIEGYESWTRVPPIVRNQLRDVVSKEEARRSFGLDPDRRTLLITGGSQGARSLNGLMMKLIERDPSSFDDWQIIHQVGSQITDDEIDSIRELYRESGIDAWVDRYIENMGEALSASTLSIGRCGAGTVAECWASKTPGLFFPYPYHEDDHQRHNAQPMVDAQCALLMDDQVDPLSNEQAHGGQIRDLLNDPQRVGSMKTGFEKLGRPDGALQIAQMLIVH